MADEAIVCADCRSEFIFTESESTFFATKGLTKPRRCKVCRQKRRDAKAVETGTSTGSSPAAPASRGRTQWVGGGEAAEPRKNKGGKRDKRRDRNSEDHGF